MRTPESPKWGMRVVEGWVEKTIERMKRGEVCRVTFEGVWRGGVKRRFLTNGKAQHHRSACEHVMQLGKEWDPPPDRIQARLWSSDKRYIGSLTWQIGARPRPRQLERGEVPQKRAAAPQKGAVASSRGATVVDAETAAFRTAILKRLSKLEGAMKSMPRSTGQQDALHRRLAEVEAENQRLREAVSRVWNELSAPTCADLYERQQALYQYLGVEWTLPKDTLKLSKEWPNITSD